MHLLQHPEQGLSHISPSFVQAAPGGAPIPSTSHSTGPPPVSPDALDDVSGPPPVPFDALDDASGVPPVPFDALDDMVSPDELPPEPVSAGCSTESEQASTWSSATGMSHRIEVFMPRP
jgi:hypothetical protein